ncbi:MAG: DUF6659 family protein [Nitrosarchaeum sp.]
MSVLTFEKSLIYESVCTQLLQNTAIQFAGFVNKKGRIVAGQIGNKFFKFEDEEGTVFLMETALEFSMKNEFNKRFGVIEYVFSKRNSANITCIPIHENILVIISESHVEPQKILEKYTSIIQKTLEVGN